MPAENRPKTGRVVIPEFDKRTPTEWKTFRSEVQLPNPSFCLMKQDKTRQSYRNCAILASEHCVIIQNLKLLTYQLDSN